MARRSLDGLHVLIVRNDLGVKSTRRPQGPLGARQESGPKFGGRVARKSAQKSALRARIWAKIGASGAFLCEEVDLGGPGKPKIGFLAKNCARGTDFRLEL